MSENFAATYTESRRRQLGFATYDLGHQQYSLRPGEIVTVAAVNKMYLLITAEPGVRILSETGQYYLRSTQLSEQKHEHSGLIRIQNNDPGIRTVTFIVVTWRAYQPKGAAAPFAVQQPPNAVQTAPNVGLPSPVKA
jgi:hypothetical protein